jgi:hypothetical protein
MINTGKERGGRGDTQRTRRKQPKSKYRHVFRRVRRVPFTPISINQVVTFAPHQSS